MDNKADVGSVVELRPGLTGTVPALRDGGLQTKPLVPDGPGSATRSWFSQAHDLLAETKVAPGGEDERPTEPNYTELSLDLQSDTKTLWVRQEHRQALGYTPALLDDILSFHNHFRGQFRGLAGTAEQKVRFLVWASRHPSVFNLGGDLALFCKLIRDGDRGRLQTYAHDCIHAIYGHATNHGLPIISIAMVQGDALGGGLESVLSSDVVIAERGARFGFPEILFGLFPAMGAYSLISRRIGAAEAEKMILSGRTYSADDMLELGLFDQVVDKGEGPEAVRRYISESQRKFAGIMSVYAARRRVNPMTLDELMDIVEMWVNAAMTLDESMLRRMELLVRAQKRQLQAGDQSDESRPAITA